ncbi:hypothetical protein PCASD_20051 [Puccinia coronata f. sp. avenae]|uniref:Uncharacterized protein n=1 Tax=Puccinia coronata f. sp. avenae TaxID=200324 RepID=A0A2N5TP95_9BASI|nr:hypothetical protein PCASD_20051 [Puccinia coronata f. sp. avenae]
MAWAVVNEGQHRSWTTTGLWRLEHRPEDEVSQGEPLLCVQAGQYLAALTAPRRHRRRQAKLADFHTSPVGFLFALWVNSGDGDTASATPMSLNQLHAATQVLSALPTGLTRASAPRPAAAATSTAAATTTAAAIAAAATRAAANARLPCCSGESESCSRHGPVFIRAVSIFVSDYLAEDKERPQSACNAEHSNNLNLPCSNYLRRLRSTNNMRAPTMPKLSSNACPICCCDTRSLRFKLYVLSSGCPAFKALDPFKLMSPDDFTLQESDEYRQTDCSSKSLADKTWTSSKLTDSRSTPSSIKNRLDIQHSFFWLEDHLLPQKLPLFKLPGAIPKHDTLNKPPSPLTEAVKTTPASNLSEPVETNESVSAQPQPAPSANVLWTSLRPIMILYIHLTISRLNQEKQKAAPHQPGTIAGVADARIGAVRPDEPAEAVEKVRRIIEGNSLMSILKFPCARIVNSLDMPLQPEILPSVMVVLANAFEANLKSASTNRLAPARGPFKAHLVANHVINYYVLSQWKHQSPAFCFLIVFIEYQIRPDMYLSKTTCAGVICNSSTKA